MKKTTSVRFNHVGKRVLVGVAGLVLGGTAWAGTIVGSAHDFSTSNWSGGQICVACHTPHGGN